MCLRPRRSRFHVTTQSIRDVMSGSIVLESPKDLWTVSDHEGYTDYLCFGYDDVTGTASFSVKTEKDGCTPVLTFTSTTGLVITADERRVSRHGKGRFPHTLCSGRRDRAFDRPFQGLDNNPQKILYALLDQNIQQNSADPQCTAAVEAFHNLGDQSAKRVAVRRCQSTMLPNLANCISNNP